MQRSWKIVIGVAGVVLVVGGTLGWWYADRTIIARMAMRDARDAHRERRDLTRAEERYTAAIRKFPVNSTETATAHLERAVVRVAMKKPEEALEDFDAAIAINPNYSTAHKGRGIELYKKGRYPEAKADLEVALATTEFPNQVAAIHYHLGLIAERSGDAWVAYDHYTEAVREQPTFARGFASLSRVFKMMGHEDNAAMYAAIAKEKDPNVTMEIE